MAEATSGPAPAPMGEAFFTLGELFQLLGYISGALIFIILIGLDIRNSFKKRARWVPGRALILSVLTIQVLNFIENQSTFLSDALENSSNCDIVLNNLFMIHTTRVMLCVIVAFFLPAMARPGYEETWGKIAALGLSVFLDIFSELAPIHKSDPNSVIYLSYYFSYWSQDKQVYRVPLFASGAIITITFIWLIFLLICAAIASKSIRRIVTQKIPIILGEPADNTWDGVEGQVLKSWIVACACDPESIIARSVLASSAAMAVTICIIGSVAKWIRHGPIISNIHGAESWLKLTTTILEVIFILMGWAVICWRSLTTVAYGGRQRKQSDEPKEECWSHYFQIEDFWTSHIVELVQEAEKLKLRKLKVALLQCVIWMQCSVVFFSKVYWLLSQLMFANSYVRKIVSIIFSSHFKKEDEDLQENKEILKNMGNVLWDQTAWDVFLSNRKSIKQAKLIMTKGNEDGRNCHALIRFLKEKRSGSTTFDEGILCLDPGTPHKEAGYKFLWKLDDPDPELDDVDRYLKYGSRRSWKLTAVSLINVIVRLSPDPDGKDCLQVYSEALGFIELADESEPGADSLLSKAADRLFTVCDAEIKKPAENSKKADTAIKTLAENSKKDAEIICCKIRNWKDSMDDWEKLVALNALYKLCKSIDCTSDGDFMELLDELQSALADITEACIKQVPTTLVGNSRKWAVDLDKEKLLQGVYIAGKRKGLIEKLKGEPELQDQKLQIISTSTGTPSTNIVVQ